MVDQVKQQLFMILMLMSTLASSLMQHRSRRFLTFPPTQPTRIQIISGIGIPVDLKIESVTIGYVFKAQFYLPENASNYLNPLNDPFDLTTQPITGMNRKRRSIEGSEGVTQSTEVPENDLSKGFDYEQNERYEKYQSEVDVIESGTEAINDNSEEVIDDGLWIDQKDSYNNDPRALKIPQYLGSSRFSLYKGIAAVVQSKGLPGKECVLRSICESAQAPFDFSSGIMGEMMHVLMTPSSTRDEVSDYSDYEYYRAERLGKEGAPCEHVFKDCKSSILEQFTRVYTPMMDLISNIIH